jgi:hypothetical protein
MLTESASIWDGRTYITDNTNNKVYYWIGSDRYLNHQEVLDAAWDRIATHGYYPIDVTLLTALMGSLMLHNVVDPDIRRPCSLGGNAMESRRSNCFMHDICITSGYELSESYLKKYGYSKENSDDLCDDQLPSSVAIEKNFCKSNSRNKYPEGNVDYCSGSFHQKHLAMLFRAMNADGRQYKTEIYALIEKIIGYIQYSGETQGCSDRYDRSCINDKIDVMATKWKEHMNENFDETKFNYWYKYHTDRNDIDRMSKIKGVYWRKTYLKNCLLNRSAASNFWTCPECDNWYSNSQSFTRTD